MSENISFRTGTWLTNQEVKGTFRLRYQLAEDGCKESQVALAKSLLRESVNNYEDRVSNAQLAVNWLIKAAEKGHEEAFLLLKSCNNSGIGVTLENRFHIEKYLRLSDLEKLSCRIGHNIYRSMMSDTEDSISEETFQERVELLLSHENVQPMEINEKSGESCEVNKSNLFSDAKNSVSSPKNNDTFFESRAPKVFNDIEELISPLKDRNEISESIKPSKLRTEKEVIESIGTGKKEKIISASDVVTSVHQCLEGNLPLLTLKKVMFQEKYGKWFSLKYVHILQSHLYRSLETLIEALASAVIPCAILFVVFILFGISYLFNPLDQWYGIIAKYRTFFISLICLATMISCTCFIIFLNFGYFSVNRWLNLVKIFEPNIKSIEGKEKYLKKTTIPLVLFYCTSIPFVLSYPMSFARFPINDLCIAGFILAVLVDRTITDGRSFVNISLFLNLLLCMYKNNFLEKLTNGWFDFLNFGVWFNLGYHYHLHLNFLSCITLPFVLPYLYTKMSLGCRKRGWLLVLLPHLMSVTWMNLAFNQLAKIQSSDIFSSLSFWFVILFIMKYTGPVGSLIICSVAKFWYLNNSFPTSKIMLIVILFCCAYLISSYMLKCLNKTETSKKCALLSCCIFAAVAFQLTVPPTKPFDISDIPLSWDKYYTHCHRNAWYMTNTAEVEIACLPLKGKAISVDGTVIGVDVVQVQNHLLKIASILPYPLYEWFTCAFGEVYSDCDDLGISSIQKQRCLLYKFLAIEGCHLHNWDVYKFQLTVEVSTRTAPEISVIVDHSCPSFITSLREGDSVSIVGVLNDKIGSYSPEIVMQQATCTSCYENKFCQSSLAKTVSDADTSLHFFTLFYLSPLIQHSDL